MNFVLFGLPVSLWYWRASLIAVSTASLPLLVKKTRLRSPGARPAMRAASSIDARVRVRPVREEAELLGLLGAGRATSARPWPMFTQNSALSPSKYRLPCSSQTWQPSPRTMTGISRAVRVGAHPAEVQPEMALGQLLQGVWPSSASDMAIAAATIRVDDGAAYGTASSARRDARRRCAWRAARRGAARRRASAARTGAGVSAEATMTRTKATAWTTMPTRRAGQRVAEDDDAAGDAADVRGGAGDRDDRDRVAVLQRAGRRVEGGGRADDRDEQPRARRGR